MHRMMEVRLELLLWPQSTNSVGRRTSCCGDRLAPRKASTPNDTLLAPGKRRTRLGMEQIHVIGEDVLAFLQNEIPGGRGGRDIPLVRVVRDRVVSLELRGIEGRRKARCRRVLHGDFVDGRVRFLARQTGTTG